jgi:hypothetical protein
MALGHDQLARPAEMRLRAFLRAEWSALGRHPNMLLVGPPRLVDTALNDLAGMVRRPVAEVSAIHYDVPPGFTSGTLIVRDVWHLAEEDQRRLHAWLDRMGQAVQVVATSRGPVYHRVATGAFLSSLYYRLNTLYIELDD